ncbi:MAG: CoA ester lyase [Neisseriaceae bacterium]|nr:CoA ester lyase [Neisseriaceae bacterium]
MTLARPLPMRSLLFVPAPQIDRVAKAIACGADAVVVDWEDAVAADQKIAARAATLTYLTAHPETKVWVRLNAVDSPYHDEDVQACARATGVIGVLLPKTECGDAVSRLAERLGKPIIALIETPVGVVHLANIATATGLHRLSYGGLDLAHLLGATPNTPGGELIMHQLRFQLLLHSQINGLAAPIDTVYPDFKDATGLAERVGCWHQMGFAGMLCIHPQQVAVVHDLLAPSPALLAWAQAVVDEANASGRLAFQLDGEMIDAPVIARAQRLLASMA